MLHSDERPGAARQRPLDPGAPARLQQVEALTEDVAQKLVADGSGRPARAERDSLGVDAEQGALGVRRSGSLMGESLSPRELRESSNADQHSTMQAGRQTRQTPTPNESGTLMTQSAKHMKNTQDKSEALWI